MLAAARERGTWLVEQVREISLSGRAPRANPALFALAAVADVCRTGTHLFTFAGYAEQFRGWGRGLRRAVASWYADRGSDDLAYQVLKYRQRDGWSRRDLLRLSHQRVTDPAARDLLRHTVSGELGDAVPPLVRTFAEVLATDDVGTWVRAIERHPLSWEMFPDAALAEPRVGHALLVPGARLVVVGMTATDVSIADPDDAGTLDVAGFDAAAPTLIAGFSRGDV